MHAGVLRHIPRPEERRPLHHRRELCRCVRVCISEEVTFKKQQLWQVLGSPTILPPSCFPCRPLHPSVWRLHPPHERRGQCCPHPTQGRVHWRCVGTANAPGILPFSLLRHVAHVVRHCPICIPHSCASNVMYLCVCVCVCMCLCHCLCCRRLDGPCRADAGNPWPHVQPRPRR